MISNASLFYRPGGGEPERYVKQHPVPFAEYIPYRSFFRNFSDKVDLVSSDFAAGEEPAAFAVPVAGDRPYWVVPTICFEVAYDDLMREATRSPAAARTSSWCRRTTRRSATRGVGAAVRHLRIRAIEHGRSVVHVSTVRQRLHQPGRNVRGQDRVVHGGCGTQHPGGPGRGDGLGPDRRHPGVRRRRPGPAAGGRRPRQRSRAARVMAHTREEEEAAVV